MKNICFCFQMHAPYRLKRYRFFEIGHDHYYYDDMATEEHVNWLVQTSYLPLCQTLKDMINLSKGKFHCAISVSGTMIEMFEQFNPEMIDILKELAATKCVEFLATPYSYSLASEYNGEEFKRQLKLQGSLLETILGVKAQSVWNTELLYTDEEAYNLNKMGYKVILSEGAKHILSWKTPNKMYQSAGAPKMKVMLRNTNLSDELSFHFSDPSWGNFPIDAEKYANQLQALPEGEDIINIWVGAETFGIRQNAGSGIFDFLKALPYFVLEREMGFITPSEAAKKMAAEDVLSSPYPLTWSGEAKDLSVYTGNDLQQEALNKLYAVTERVHLCQDKNLKTNWLRLQDVNYLHYDFLQTVEEQYPTTIENEELNELLKTIRNQEEEIQQLQAKLKKAKK